MCPLLLSLVGGVLCLALAASLTAEMPDPMANDPFNDRFGQIANSLSYLSSWSDPTMVPTGGDRSTLYAGVNSVVCCAPEDVWDTEYTCTAWANGYRISLAGLPQGDRLSSAAAKVALCAAGASMLLATVFLSYVMQAQCWTRTSNANPWKCCYCRRAPACGGPTWALAALRLGASGAAAACLWISSQAYAAALSSFRAAQYPQSVAVQGASPALTVLYIAGGFALVCTP